MPPPPLSIEDAPLEKLFVRAKVKAKPAEGAPPPPAVGTVGSSNHNAVGFPAAAAGPLTVHHRPAVNAPDRRYNEPKAVLLAQVVPKPGPKTKLTPVPYDLDRRARDHLSSADLSMRSLRGIGKVDPRSVETLEKLNLSMPIVAPEQWTGIQFPSGTLPGARDFAHRLGGTSPRSGLALSIPYASSPEPLPEKPSALMPPEHVASRPAVASGTGVITAAAPLIGAAAGAKAGRLLLSRGWGAVPMRERARPGARACGLPSGAAAASVSSNLVKSKGHETLGAANHKEDGGGSVDETRAPQSSSALGERSPELSQHDVSRFSMGVGGRYASRGSVQHVVLTEQEKEVHKTHDRIMLEMKDCLQRVDTMMGALQRNHKYVSDTAYLEAEATANSGVDPAKLEELKAVVQVLLKDIAKQTAQSKALEVADQRKDALVKEAREEAALRKRQGETEKARADELQEQLDVARARVAELESSSSPHSLRKASSLRKSLSTPGSMILGKKRDGAHSMIPPFIEALLAQDALPEESTSLGSPTDLAGIVGKGGYPRGPSRDLIPEKVTVAPMGEVAVVCTAIQGQQVLWEHFPTEMRTAVTMHNKVIREELRRFHGYEVKNCADEFMVVFQSVWDSIRFANAVHLGLVAECWPDCFALTADTKRVANSALAALKAATSADIRSEGGSDDGGFDGDDGAAAVDDEELPSNLWSGLRLRIGIHFGKVVVEPNPQTGGADYMGSVVNRSLHLRRIAFGGMTAISRDVYRMIASVAAQAEHGLGHLVLAHHCTLPDPFGAGESPVLDVYSVLPSVLEDRVADIQAAMREMAKHGNVPPDAVLAHAHVSGDDAGGPTELEKLLGKFKKTETGPTMVVTYEGIFEAAVCLATEDGAAAIADARLPSGEAAFMTIRPEGYAQLKAQLKVGELARLLQVFYDAVLLMLPLHGGRMVTAATNSKTATAFVVFPSALAAVRCALAIDAEALHAPWPHDVLEAAAATAAGDVLATVDWRAVRVFRGLRPCIGVQSCANAEPRYDVMTRTVLYSGRDALIAARLSEIARGGQLLIQEHEASLLLGLLQPTPIFFSLTVPRQHDNDEAMRLCIVCAKAYVGRFFVHNRMDSHSSALLNPLYRDLRDQLLRESLRWQRKLATTAPVMQSKTTATGDLPVNADVRRTIATAHVMANQFARRIRRNGTSDPILSQLEVIEGNLMQLHDGALQGDAPELVPCLVDPSDLNGIVGVKDGGGANVYIENVEGVDMLSIDQEAKAKAEAQLDAELVGATDRRVAGVRAKKAAMERDKRFATVEEELASVKDQVAQQSKELFATHRDVRFALSMMRGYLEPLVDANRLVLGDDEIILRLLIEDREVREELEVKKFLGGAKVADDWRELQATALEKEGEEAMADDPQRLTRSMFGHTARFFTFLRGFMRRFRARAARTASTK